MAGSDPDTFASTVDEIIASLRQDPVLVEEVMGNGHTAEIAAALSQKAAAVDVPVYVVLTKAPAGLSTDQLAEELLTLLHAETGWDGVWYVATSEIGHDQFAVYGDLDPSVDNEATMLESARWHEVDRLEQAVRAECADCSHSQAAEAGVVLDMLAKGIPQEYRTDILTTEQLEAYATSTWWQHHPRYEERIDPAGLPTPGLTAMVATAVGITVTVVAYRLVQSLVAVGSGTRSGGAMGRRTSSAAEAANRQELRAAIGKAARSTARIQVEALGRRLERPRASIPFDRRDVAQGCYERAVPLLDTGDLLDLVGAEVLARTGLHALSKGGVTPYRCCYVDPRHGAARTEASVGRGLKVPVCDSCAADLRRNKPLRALEEETRFGRTRPYYSGDTAWARTGFGSLDPDWWKELPR